MALPSLACLRRVGRVPSLLSHPVPPISATAQPFVLGMGLR